MVTVLDSFRLTPLKENVESEDNPLFVRMISWTNLIQVFQYKEKKDPNPLRDNQDHRAALSSLIAMGENLLLECSLLENVDLSPINLSVEAIASQVEALRLNMEITHGDLMSPEQAEAILSRAFHAEPQAA